MRVEYHPAVEHDVAEALRRYDAVSERLGDEFKAELRRVVRIAAKNPNRFHPIKPGFHRANLKRFPYHFIYREIAGGIRVTFHLTPALSPSDAERERTRSSRRRAIAVSTSGCQ